MYKSILFVVIAVGTGFAQSGTWSNKANLPTGRFWLASGVVGEKVFAIGGADEDLTRLAATEEYDAMTNTWTRKANMPTARFAHCVCVVNGKVYAIGGRDDVALQTVEEYDPATNTWTAKADMPTARMGVCETVNGKIYVLGGGTVSPTGGEVLSVVEEYDPATNTWATKASMPRARVGHASSVVNGQIYVMGGFNTTSTLPGGFVDKVDVYNPATNTWTTITADLPTLRDNLSASPLNGIIHVIGGQSSSGEPLSTVEAYNPASNTWSTRPSMPTGRLALTAAAAGGRLYAIGGTNSSFSAFSIVQEYNPNPATAVETKASEATSFDLRQNYPNPFNPTTWISYEIIKPATVVLKIINIFGQEVRTLVDDKQAAGFYQVQWDGKDDGGAVVASGIYFYRLAVEKRNGDAVFTETRRMALVK